MASSETKRVVYLDANATTLMSDETVAVMQKWVNRGNPSSDHAAAEAARRMMGRFKNYLAEVCGYEPEDFLTIFTSGASESNATIVNSVTRGYRKLKGVTPHVIISAVEHKSLAQCCADLADDGLIEVSVVPVGHRGPALGQVDPESVRKAIKENTCLISIMAANNETGIINPLREIAKIAKTAKIPFHSDVVQMLAHGDLDVSHVDAFSASFHKLHGPPGCGILVVRKNLVSGYGMRALISGTQNEGMRGGTESLHNIAASYQGVKETFASGHELKKIQIARLRDVIRTVLSRKLPCFYLDEFRKKPFTGPICIVWISAEEKHAAHNAAHNAANMPHAPHNAHVLGNTLFLSVCRKDFCNKAARAALASRGIIVSVGSACNAASHAPSGVVAAMEIPHILQDGVLRVSLDDTTTLADIQQFVTEFQNVILSADCLKNKGAETAHSRSTKKQIS